MVKPHKGPAVPRKHNVSAPASEDMLLARDKRVDIFARAHADDPNAAILGDRQPEFGALAQRKPVCAINMSAVRRKPEGHNWDPASAEGCNRIARCPPPIGMGARYSTHSQAISPLGLEGMDQAKACARLRYSARRGW